MTLFLDIDGTLLDHGTGPFDDDVEAIRAARRGGGMAFLNTGRSFANIPAALLQADWIDGVVCGGGAHVLLKDLRGHAYRTVYRKSVPRDALRKAAVFYLSENRWCLFEGEDAVYTLNRCDNGLPNTNSGVVTSEDFFGEESPDMKTPITKLTMEGGILPEEEKILSPYLRLFYQNGYHEGIIIGENKAKGMEILLRELGEDIADSVAVGDSANDMDMIRAAGTGVALGNACAELKAAAAYISAPCGRGGIAEALDHITGGITRGPSRRGSR